MVFLAALLLAQLPGPPAPPATPPVIVGGTAQCPSPEAVAARLPSFLRADDTAAPAPAHRARVDVRDGLLQLALEDARGRLIAERTLDGKGSCAALAEAAAVVLASWQSTIAPADIPTLKLGAAPRATADARSSASLFDVGAGVLLSLGEGAWTAGARAQVVWARVGGGLGLYAAGQGTGTRAASFADGEVNWRRWSAELGPAYVAPLQSWQIAGSAGVQAGWLTAHGSGFPVSHGGTRFSPGLFALVRLLRAFDTAATWVTLGAAVPMVESNLVIIGRPETRALRPLEVHLTLGGSFGRFR